MDKWADYAICAVKYNDEKTHIEKVKRFKDLGGDSFDEPAAVKTRSAIIDAIKNKNRTYVTTYKHDGKWQKGAEVSIQTVDGVDYIRTDSNKIKKDNLGTLPEF
ncbi:MAG: DUF3892 domain-containing protein [Sphingobacteriaceae bacterium]|nr:DUF3892 domain-containing protein [Sphingobacteriaceae bacterium]